MHPRYFSYYLAVIALASCSVPPKPGCSYNETSWHCLGIKTVTQLFNVSDFSLVNQTYPKVTRLAIKQSSINIPENIVPYFPNVETVDLGESEVNCTEMVWLFTWRGRISDPNNLLCSGLEWQLGGRQALKVFNLIMYLNETCPSGCSCAPDHVRREPRRNETDESKSSVEINCSNLGLTALPRVLPGNVSSIRLDVSNNKITDISELATNELYRKVSKLNLTNNLITSISKLEGSKWMENAQMLSLQGNRMTKIPIDVLYATYRLMDTTAEGNRFYLRSNPWRCDCYGVTNFQRLMTQATRLIGDAKDVTCGPHDGEIAGKQIKEIELSAVCVSDETIMEMAMNGLNVFLAFITALTVGKLLYDFYAYRKTGQLPWLASKLP